MAAAFLTWQVLASGGKRETDVEMHAQHELYDSMLRRASFVIGHPCAGAGGYGGAGAGGYGGVGVGGYSMGVWGE